MRTDRRAVSNQYALCARNIRAKHIFFDRQPAPITCLCSRQPPTVGEVRENRTQSRYGISESVDILESEYHGDCEFFAAQAKKELRNEYPFPVITQTTKSSDNFA